MRYAIYYVPAADSPLGDFGARVLGYDIERAAAGERLPLPGIGVDRLVQVTRRAARYGFHATLKAPFRLAAGCSKIDILKATADTADRCHPVTVPGLEVATLGNFVALRPLQHSVELDAIAAAFVQDLDPLRAKGPRDEKRWPPGSLSAHQEELLDAWGYPYVLDQYRFHMTLTDALDADEVAVFSDALRMAGVGLLGVPLTIDSVTVMEESSPAAPFRLAARFRLRGLRRDRAIPSE